MANSNTELSTEHTLHICHLWPKCEDTRTWWTSDYV